MSNKEEVKKLSEEETHLRQYWKDVINHVELDLSYVWTDEVKKDFEGIKGSARRIEYILKRLKTWYEKSGVTDKAMESIFEDEIGSIELLLSHLRKLRSKRKYILILYRDLKRIIQDTEKLKSEVAQSEREQLIDRFVLDFVMTWIILEKAANIAKDNASQKTLVPLLFIGKAPARSLKQIHTETKQKLIFTNEGAYHLLKSFTENILDASDVVRYFRGFLPQFNLPQARGSLKNRAAFLLGLKDTEIISSLERLKEEIKKFLEKTEKNSP